MYIKELLLDHKGNILVHSIFDREDALDNKCEFEGIDKHEKLELEYLNYIICELFNDYNHYSLDVNETIDIDVFEYAVAEAIKDSHKKSRSSLTSLLDKLQFNHRNPQTLTESKQ